MSFDFPYTLATSEKIPVAMQSNSVMRGLDRTALKSPTQLRKVGYFYHGIYQYATLSPYPRYAGQTVAQYYQDEFYMAQVDCHLDTDPILSTMNFNRLADDIVFNFDGTIDQNKKIEITNNDIVNKYQNNIALPPNTNVYFVIVMADLNFFETTTKQPTVYDLRYQGEEQQAFLILYSLIPPRPFSQGTGIRAIKGDVNNANTYRGGINGRGAYVAQFRTDSTGKIAGLNLNSPATGFNNAGGGKIYPNFTANDHRTSSADLTSNPFTGAIPDFWNGLQLQVRKVVDRYDTGANVSNPTPEGFHARMYQELIDNEWDTKVVTDA